MQLDNYRRFGRQDCPMTVLREVSSSIGKWCPGSDLRGFHESVRIIADWPDCSLERVEFELSRDFLNSQ